MNVFLGIMKWYILYWGYFGNFGVYGCYILDKRGLLYVRRKGKEEGERKVNKIVLKMDRV